MTGCINAGSLDVEYETRLTACYAVASTLVSCDRRIVTSAGFLFAQSAAFKSASVKRFVASRFASTHGL
jgi:hypothetical protein